MLLFAGRLYAQQVIPISSGVVSIDVFQVQNFKIALNANVTSVSLNNPRAGEIVTLLFQQDSVGGRTVTFGGNINSASIPTITATAGVTTLVTLQYDSNSNTWYGISAVSYGGGGGGGVSPGTSGEPASYSSSTQVSSSGMFLDCSMPVFSGATIDVTLNNCITAAKTTTHRADASGLPATGTIAAQVNFGDVGNVNAIEVRLPSYFRWDMSGITDGTSCGFKLWGASYVHSDGPGGVPNGWLTITNNTAHPYAMICTDGTQGIYTHLSGVRVRNSGTGGLPNGGVMASNADIVWNWTFDGANATDTSVNDFAGNLYGLEVLHSCCGTHFDQMNVGMNSQAGTTGIYVHSATGAENQEVVFNNPVSNGGCSNNIKIDDTSAIHASSVRIHNLYEEGCTTSNSYTANAVDGTASVTVDGETFKSEIASSTSPAWSISNTANTEFSIRDLWFTGQPVLPLTAAVINNNTTSCPSTPCNIPSDGNGNLAYFMTAPGGLYVGSGGLRTFNISNPSASGTLSINSGSASSTGATWFYGGPSHLPYWKMDPNGGTNPDFTIDSLADTGINFIINSGSSAAQTENIQFKDRGTILWQLQSQSSGNFQMFDQTNNIAREIYTPTNITFHNPTGSGTFTFNASNNDSTGGLAVYSGGASSTIASQLLGTGSIQFGISGANYGLLSITPTAARTFTFPDASGTIPLLGSAQSFSAAQTFSAAGAASTPGVLITGAPFAGNGTTSMPQLFEDCATSTQPTTWGTSGTYFGINSCTVNADLMAFHTNGGSAIFAIAGTGKVLALEYRYNNGRVFLSPTAPTVSSGFGSGPSIPANNGTGAFTVNVGTGASATSGVIAMPTATTGWICHVNNLTAKLGHRADQTFQTATATGTVTVENQTVSTGAAVAWAASDILQLSCLAY